MNFVIGTSLPSRRGCEYRPNSYGRAAGGDIRRVSLFGDRLHVIVEGDGPAAARRLTGRLERDGIRVLEATEQDYSLEDVFLAIVEKNRGAEEQAAAA